MEGIMKLQVIPEALDVRELMEIKGGDNSADQCTSSDLSVQKCVQGTLGIIKCTTYAVLVCTTKAV